MRNRTGGPLSTKASRADMYDVARSGSCCPVDRGTGALGHEVTLFASGDYIDDGEAGAGLPPGPVAGRGEQLAGRRCRTTSG